MKKIFYFIASAIVALGAVACQNEVDENITPENTNEITFTVSFDESTRIAGTVNSETKKATFVFEGNETLCVGGAVLKNTKEKVNTFTADEENKAILNELFGDTVTATVDDANNGLTFTSTKFTLAAENDVTLSLACPALYFTVPAETTATLSVNGVEEGDYTEGSYFVGVSSDTETVAYSANGVTMKNKNFETTLENKVYNLGTLSGWKVMGINVDWETGINMEAYKDNYVVAKNVLFDGDDAIKVVANGKYINTLPNDNKTMEYDTDGNLKPANGTYDIYMYATIEEQTIFICKAGTTSYESKWGVVGNNNGWDVANPTTFMHDFDSDIYTGTVTFTDGKEFKLSQYGAENWNGCVTATNDANSNNLVNGETWSPLWWNNAGGNFVLPEAGTWNFEVSFTKQTIKVTKQ